MKQRQHYTSDEVGEITRQAVHYAEDVHCPRDGDAMAFRMVLVVQSPDSQLETIELRCEQCAIPVPAKTGFELRDAFAKVLGFVRKGIRDRGRDPIVVGFDDRWLKVTIEDPKDADAKFAYTLTAEDLTAAEVVAARILKTYDLDAKA